MKHLLIRLTLAAVILILGVVGGGWAWVLAAQNSLAVPVSQWLPWPVACSTRGCVTTWSWQRQYRATEVFATLIQREQPTPEQTLTTLVRQHLAHYSQLTSPVTSAEAVRYREEILNAKDETQIQQATGLSMGEYDELVILPFLEQESARQQRRAENAEDLYKQLAGERWVVALPLHLTWNKDEAKVIEN